MPDTFGEFLSCTGCGNVWLLTAGSSCDIVFSVAKLLLWMSPLKKAIYHGDTEITEDITNPNESLLCVGINSVFVFFVSLWWKRTFFSRVTSALNGKSRGIAPALCTKEEKSLSKWHGAIS